MDAHALTIRLPDRVYRAARNLAARRGISINRLVQEAIAEKARKTVKDRLKRAYDLLADDRSGSDVEDALPLQAEAILHD